MFTVFHSFMSFGDGERAISPPVGRGGSTHHVRNGNPIWGVQYHTKVRGAICAVRRIPTGSDGERANESIGAHGEQAPHGRGRSPNGRLDRSVMANTAVVRGNIPHSIDRRRGTRRFSWVLLPSPTRTSSRSVDRSRRVDRLAALGPAFQAGTHHRTPRMSPLLRSISSLVLGYLERAWWLYSPRPELEIQGRSPQTAQANGRVPLLFTEAGANRSRAVHGIRSSTPH